MSYTKTIVCLATSVKHGGVCIAGREIAWGTTGPWLRPISTRASLGLSPAERAYQTHGLPKLLDILDIPLLTPSPHAHQTENHVIDPTQRWRKRDELPFAHLGPFLETPSQLWTNSDHSSTGTLNCISPAEAATHNCSLYLIATPFVFLERILKPHANPVFRGTFAYNNTQYKLPVTDTAATSALAHLPDNDPEAYSIIRNPYLCISLSETFAHDHRCHKLIAAIITPELL